MLKENIVRKCRNNEKCYDVYRILYIEGWIVDQENTMIAQVVIGTIHRNLIIEYLKILIKIDMIFNPILVLFEFN